MKYILSGFSFAQNNFLYYFEIEPVLSIKYSILFTIAIPKIQKELTYLS